jgi:hypothetical protein
MKRAIVLMCLLALLITTGCADRHIGSNTAGYWFRFDDLPMTNVLRNETFEITFQISKGETEGEYVLDGYLDAKKGVSKNWSRIIMSKSIFELYLAKDYIVVSKVSFRPGGVSLSKNMPFHRTFNSVPFDSGNIFYRIKYGI